MVRIVIAACVAMLVAVFPTAAGEYQFPEPSQMTRWMRFETSVYTVGQQAAARDACELPLVEPEHLPTYRTGSFLRELGLVNGMMDEKGLTISERYTMLVEVIGLPAQCVLYAKAVRDGAPMTIISITSRIGDLIISEYEREVWRWDRWRKNNKTFVISRQDPNDPNRWMNIIN